MAYKSLYRKYRPNNFDDVCGQEFIVKTLKNAIATNKISHAYLFAGTRGTGKTTIAKIFAKEINCLNIEDGKTCGKCEICTNTNTDEIQDIIEIDAASNNGVDEIRELKNMIKLVPVLCKYKVYIIDEVHMLSKGAFNALLKTLEEPPEHVIFILATTEPQKLPITIISRCQEFDFKKISIENIIKRLKHIAKKEDIDIDDECLNEIAEMSDGALRDAIGLLDQVSLFSNKKISINDVYLVTGNTSNEVLCKLVDYYIQKDYKNILKTIDELYISGKDFSKISEKLLMMFRNILIYKKAPKYFESGDNVLKNWVIETSKNIDSNKLNNIINEIDELIKNISSSNYPRIQLEIFMLKDIDETSLENEKKEIQERKPNLIVESEKIKEVEPVVEKKKEIIIEDDKTKLKVLENEYTNETRLSFDENSFKKAYINNTIVLANNKCKKEIQQKLENLDKYLINKKYKTEALILKDATVTAASDDHILFTYKYASIVDDNDKSINKIKLLIKEILDKEYEIVAITEDEWKEMRPYYLEQKKNNKLVIIEEFKNINIENKNTNELKEFDEVIEEFGDDLVEMEG